MTNEASLLPQYSITSRGNGKQNARRLVTPSCYVSFEKEPYFDRALLQQPVYLYMTL